MYSSSELELELVLTGLEGMGGSLLRPALDTFVYIFKLADATGCISVAIMSNLEADLEAALRG